VKKIWVKKLKSFKSATEPDIDYYLSMSPAKRLETMQILREMIFKFKKGSKYERGREGLRRVIKIIK